MASEQAISSPEAGLIEARRMICRSFQRRCQAYMKRHGGGDPRAECLAMIEYFLAWLATFREARAVAAALPPGAGINAVVTRLTPGMSSAERRRRSASPRMARGRLERRLSGLCDRCGLVRVVPGETCGECRRVRNHEDRERRANQRRCSGSSDAA